MQQLTLALRPRPLSWLGLMLTCLTLVLASACSKDGGRGPTAGGTGGAGGTTAGDGGSGVPVDDTVVRTKIGPAGGTVIHPTGAQLIVPVGALGEEVELSIQGVEPPAEVLAAGKVLGQSFLFGPEGQQFARPVLVILPIDPTRFPFGANTDDTRLWIAAKGESEQWELESKTDVRQHRLSGETMHFSVLSAMLPTTNDPVTVPTARVLPGAKVKKDYTSSLAATGGTDPYTWSRAGGFVPPGLTLADTGGISGTPTAPGAYYFSARVVDGAQHRLERIFSIGVAPQDPYPLPTLTAISPELVTASAADVTLTLTGTRFVAESVAQLDTTDLVTTFVSSTELSAVIPAARLSTGTHQVTVVTPAPGGGATLSKKLIVEGVSNPVPELTAIAPAELAIGGTDAELQLTGTGFVDGATVYLGGQGGIALATTFVSATELTAILPTAYRQSPVTLTLAVWNPPPGGGQSAGVLLGVGAVNPVPTITGLSPGSVEAGTTGFSLTVYGSELTYGAVVFVDGVACDTTYVSDTEVTALVPDLSLATPREASVTVHNPAPGGGASGAFALVVMSKPEAGTGAPVITGVSPGSALAGGNALVVTITVPGAAAPSSVVRVDGTQVQTTYMDTDTLTAVLPASALASAGSLAITVETPGRGISNPSQFGVLASGNPVPSIASFSPATVQAGTFTEQVISIQGSSFVSGATVSIDGVVYSGSSVEFVDATLLRVTVPAGSSTWASAGQLSFVVTNPAPGGGASSPVQFSVIGSNPPGDVLSVTPSVFGTGTAAYTVAIQTANGTSKSNITITSGATQLSAGPCTGKCFFTLPASLFTSAGTITFALVNPAPGGGSGQTRTATVVAGEPTPQITSVSPPYFVAGSSAQTVTVNGSGFTANTTLSVGTAATITNRTATTLTATVPASALASAGILVITATNPGPAGGTATTFATCWGAPNITSITPTSVPAGQPFTLTLDGSGFVQGGLTVVVRVGTLDFTAVTGTDASVSLSVPAVAVPSAGTVPVSAYFAGHELETWGKSNTVNLTVQ